MKRTCETAGTGSRRRKRMLLALATLIAALGVAEIAVRILQLAPPLVNDYQGRVADPGFPYRPKPGIRFSGVGATGEFTFDYAHNSLGLRDVDHAWEKPAGVFRLLGLGDSYTYGAGVSLEETYLSRLELMLNSDPGVSHRVEVIKAGIPRWFPEAQRIFLECYGTNYVPDLIVVGFLPNDIIDTALGLDAIVIDATGYMKTLEAAQLGSVGVFLFVHSHFCRLLLERYTRTMIRLKIHTNWDDVYRHDGIHEADWLATEAEYGRMARIAKRIGAEMLIVHIPMIGPWEARHHYPADRLASWAKAHDVHFVDTLPTMTTVSATTELYYPKDRHCRPAGHAVIARCIRDYLRTAKLLE